MKISFDNSDDESFASEKGFIVDQPNNKSVDKRNLLQHRR